MADVEPEQPQDDFEIEITDIDALESAASSYGRICLSLTLMSRDSHTNWRRKHDSEI